MDTPLSAQQPLRDRTLITSRARAEQTAAQRLRNLAALRDQGLVSEDEFAQKRRELVDEL